MKIQRFYSNNNSLLSKIREHVMFTCPLMLYAPISYFLILWHRLTHRKKNYKYNVSLCLIFKDECHYLKEWIEYHKLIGIDHFYLYNNNSTDNYLKVLAPYINEGSVTLIDFHEQYAQVKAYNDCYSRTKNETEWLGYIDIDEFINLIKHDSIKTLLNSLKIYPSVYFNWRMFGTSGHLKENYDDLTIERYTQTWNNLSLRGKGFINNNYDNHEVTVHFHTTKFYGLPIFGTLVNRSLYWNMHFLFSLKIDKIAYLNHYWSRSFEFQIYKHFFKGDVADKHLEEMKKESHTFEQNELRNKTKDFSIQRWLVLLKLRLNA